MTNNDLIVSYPGFFVSELREETLWVKMSGNFFHNYLSFDNLNLLPEFFARLAEAREIKTVVLHSAFNASGGDEYMRFFLFDCPERELGHFGFSNTMQRYELHRFCNVINQAVLDIFTMDKIFIHICRGDVLSLFMNISLACDYRIVATDTVFHNVYQEIGMLPKGGGPYFLARTIGASRAKALLLKPRITAREALDSCIADDVVPTEDLEKRAMEVARSRNLIPEKTLFGVKRLVNYYFQDLQAYLDYETEAILKIGQRKNFDDQ